MTVQPLGIPAYSNINSLADFSPLAKLGEVYKQAANQQKLADLGKQLASGNIDYRSAAGQTADMGDINSTLKFLALSEEEKKRVAETAASGQFRQGLSSLYGSGAAPSAASTIMPPPSVNPAISSPTPLQPRAPVQPSGTAWGDKEAEDAGLYEPKPGAPPVVAGPPQAAPQAALPQAAPEIDPARPVAAHIPYLIGALSDPNLPAGPKELAKTLLTRALDDAKPNEQIQFLEELKAKSNFPVRSWS
jgi:hypothetical protein